MVTGGDGQRGQSLVHNERNLDILVQRQGAIADYIDVDLVELAETALLGAALRARPSESGSA